MGLALLQFFFFSFLDFSSNFFWAFFFFCLKVEQINFFYLFEGVPNFVTEGVPKYRANIKNFNYYI